MPLVHVQCVINAASIVDYASNTHASTLLHCRWQGFQGSYPLWTPYMYTPNKPTKWEPWMDWRADYGLMARRNNRIAQRQMMVMMAAQQPEVIVPEVQDAGRPNLAEGQMMAMVSPPKAGGGLFEDTHKPSLMLEPEYAGEQEAEEAEIPRAPHKNLDERGVKTEGYPEEIGFDPEKVDYEKPGVSPFQDWPLSSAGKLSDIGVNVDRCAKHVPAAFWRH
jgi:hypothetical protein